MKICILTPRFPYPENGGDVLRINAIARYLRAKGHKLILVSYYNNKEDLQKTDQLYEKIYTIKQYKYKSVFYSFFSLITGKCLQTGYYYSKSYLKLLRKVVSDEQPDLFISHLLPSFNSIDLNILT